MQLFYYLSVVFVLGGIGSALVIAIDLHARRQPMRIMNSVWVLTGLWASLFGLWAYFAFGRAPRNFSGNSMDSTTKGKTGRGNAVMPDMNRIQGSDTTEMPGKDGMPKSTGMEMPKMTRIQVSDAMKMPGRIDLSGADGMDGMEIPGRGGMPMSAGMEMPETARMQGGDTMNMPGMEMPVRPKWQSVVLSTLHCGAGCTLADIIGEWALYFVPVAIGGSLLAGTWVVDYLLALLFGIGFQYAAIRGMEPSLPRGAAVGRAAKADILSLTAWQAGMYGWMAMAIFALGNGTPMPRTSFMFWFMMQVAMACGFLLSLPVNVLLIRKGIKKGM